MPITINATLKNGLDNNAGTPIIKINLAKINGAGFDTKTSTDILFYELSNLKLKVRIKATTVGAFEPSQYETYIQVERGLSINGTDYTLKSSWYTVKNTYRDYYYIELTAEIFPTKYITTPADISVSALLTSLMTLINTGVSHHTTTVSYLASAEWWKTIKFYAAGNSFNTNNPNSIESVFKQKYIAQLCDVGGQDIKVIGGSSIAELDPAPDFTMDYRDFASFNINFKLSSARSYIWRDEANTVHTLGLATYVKHNLGYIESTVNVTAGQVQQIYNFPFDAVLTPPRLDIANGDYLSCVLPFTAGNNAMTARVLITETFDPNHKFPWRQTLKGIEWLNNTEGGALPSTIEAAAPYTPLVTNFTNVLSSNDNNLQAAMETLDDHTHTTAADTEIVQDIVGGMVTGNTETGITVTYDDPGGKLNFDAQTAGDARYALTAKGVTNGDSHDHNGGDGAAIPAGGLSSKAVTLAKLSDASFSPGGRLTLTTGLPVTSADVTAATTIYYTPYIHDLITLWDGSNWTPVTFTEQTQALGTLTAARGYDVFGYLSAGALAIEILVWTSATVRATAITIQGGRYCKSGDKTRLYLGSFYTSSTTTTEDSLIQRYVWNMYNRIPRELEVVEGTSHNYNIATIRAWNNVQSAADFEWFLGLAMDTVLIAPYAQITRAALDGNPRSRFGLNSTTTEKGLVGIATATVVGRITGGGTEIVAPSLGYSYACILEFSTVGTAPGTTFESATMNGVVMA